MLIKNFKAQFFIFALSGLLLATGCTPKIGEQPPEQVAIEFGTQKCFSDAMINFKKFVLGTSSNREIVSAVECVGLSMKQFKKYVVGSRRASQYEPQEIADFIEKNFLTDKRTLAPGLQVEFMKLKQLLIGGSKDYMTRAEIDQVILFLDQLKSILETLNPHMEILTMNWNPSGEAEIERFEKANEALQQATRQLAGVISKNGVAYQIDDFVVFLTELSTIYNEQWQFIGSIQKYLPVVKKVKKIISGGEEDTISAKEWGVSSQLGARGYVQYLRYFYFIEKAYNKTQPIKLQYVIRSMDDIFSIAEDLVVNKESQKVTEAELSELISTLRQTWGYFNFSDEFVHEFLKFKKVILGGDDSYLSKVDFKNARFKISKLRFFLEKFFLYYDVFTMKWNSEDLPYEDSINYFLEAQKGLIDSISGLDFVFESDYKYDDFVALMREFEKTMSLSKSQESFADQLQKIKPVFVNYKNIVLGDKSDQLQKTEWVPFVTATVKIYSGYLYYYYFLSQREYQENEFLNSSLFLAEDSLRLLNDVIKYRSHQLRFPKLILPQADLVDFVYSFKEAKLANDGMTKKSINSLLTFVFDKLLVSPDVRLKKIPTGGLSPAALQRIQSELQRWGQSQEAIYRIYSGVSDGLSQAEVLSRINAEIRRGSNSEELKKTLRELASVVNSKYPLVFNKENILDIGTTVSGKISKKSLSISNGLREVSSLIISSVAMDLDRATVVEKMGVKKQELIDTLQLLEGILKELKIYEIPMKNFVSSRFLEGNIFTPRGNGDDNLDFLEMVDLSSMMASGIFVQSKFQEHLNTKCIKKGSKETVVTYSCLFNVITLKMPDVLESLPQMLSFRKLAIRENEWSEFFLNTLKAIGFKPTESTVPAGIYTLLPHILQYTEMSMLKLDLDHNGFIDDYEAAAGFKTYKPLLKELAKGAVNDSELLPLFAYILKNGHPPETLGEKINFKLFWPSEVGAWDVWADRTQFSKILGYIADQVNSPNQVKVQQILTQWPDTSK